MMKWLDYNTQRTLQLVLVTVTAFFLGNPEQVKELLGDVAAKWWPLASAVAQAVLGMQGSARDPKTGAVVRGDGGSGTGTGTATSMDKENSDAR